MFLPGAGQFSIHQQFPQPQTFVPQAGTSGGSASRKPPAVKPGKKSGGIASYQTVFSLAETSGPGPATPTSASPEEIPHGSSQSSTSPPHRAGSHPYYSWTDRDSQTGSPTVLSSPTPVTSFKQEPFEPENGYNTDRPPFPQYPPISASYVPQILSPTFPSKSNIKSPLSPPYSQHQNHGLVSSPPTNSQKSFHPSPNHFSTPPKRVRRLPSPPLLPTPHPTYYTDNYSNGTMHTVPTHIPTINAAYHSIINDNNSPFDQASIANTAQEYNFDLPSVNVYPDRRLSVASILSPVSSDAVFQNYHNRLMESANNRLDYNNQTVIYASSSSRDHNANDDDDDIETIPRYDLSTNGFGPLGYRMTPASTYYQKAMSIPRGLDPLPAMLVENDKNMMYFKHFLRFTARLLVPHDCSENPFKKVLPQSTYLE